MDPRHFTAAEAAVNVTSIITGVAYEDSLGILVLEVAGNVSACGNSAEVQVTHEIVKEGPMVMLLLLMLMLLLLL